MSSCTLLVLSLNHIGLTLLIGRRTTNVLWYVDLMSKCMLLHSTWALDQGHEPNFT